MAVAARAQRQSVVSNDAPVQATAKEELAVRRRRARRGPRTVSVNRCASAAFRGPPRRPSTHGLADSLHPGLAAVVSREPERAHSSMFQANGIAHGKPNAG